MARFETTFEKVYTTSAPLDAIADHMANVDAIVPNYGPLESHTRIDDHTVKYVQIKHDHKIVVFQGTYTAHYERDGNQVRWKTLEDASTSLWSHGTIDFTEVGGQTQFTYKATIAVEVQVPRLMKRMVGPILISQVQKEMDAYVQRMLGCVPSI